MTSLNGLLEYAFLFAGPKTKMLFPKGKSYGDELLLAQQGWFFDIVVHKNKVCDDGVVLLLENLRRKIKK